MYLKQKQKRKHFEWLIILSAKFFARNYEILCLWKRSATLNFVLFPRYIRLQTGCGLISAKTHIPCDIQYNAERFITFMCRTGV